MAPIPMTTLSGGHLNIAALFDEHTKSTGRKQGLIDF